MNSQHLYEIGRRIYQRRKQIGYTQEYLAELMNVSVQMVSNLERGNKAIRIDNLIKLSEILSVSTDYILMGKLQSSDLQESEVLLSQLSEKERKMIHQIIHFCADER